MLQDIQTGVFPVVSYWKQSVILSDNRIPAGESDTSVYYFAAPDIGSTVVISAELRFRRLFQVEMDARGWQTADIIMEQVETSTVVESRLSVYLPVMVKPSIN